MTTTMSNVAGREITRAEVSALFGIALTTVDAWVRRGCPIVEKGGRGIPHKFDSAAVFWWAVEDAQRR